MSALLGGRGGSDPPHMFLTKIWTLAVCGVRGNIIPRLHKSDLLRLSVSELKRHQFQPGTHLIASYFLSAHESDRSRVPNLPEVRWMLPSTCQRTNLLLGSGRLLPDSSICSVTFPPDRPPSECPASPLTSHPYRKLLPPGGLPVKCFCRGLESQRLDPERWSVWMF